MTLRDACYTSPAAPAHPAPNTRQHPQPRSWVAYTPGADEIELGLAAPPGSGAGDPRAVTVNTSWLRHNCAALLEESSGQKIGRSVDR